MEKENDVKIIGLISSPHKNGNSASLAREALRAAEDVEAHVKEVYLPEYDLKYCKGCMNCVSGEKCLLNDDLNTLRKQIEDSDGIIISSPTYGLMPNALMMNFLQRLGMYSTYRSSLADKYVIGISTAGGVGPKKVAKYLTNITDGLFEVGYRTGILGVKLGNGGIKNEDKNAARELGKRLVKDINEQKKYRLQKIFNKFISTIAIKPIMKKNLRRNKDDTMKGVYEYLKAKGKI
jgi:multimeric flavodoxin WrbA